MDEINAARRQALKQGSASAIFGMFVAAGLIRPGAAHAAWNQAAFSVKGVDSVVKSLGGAGTAATKDINWGSTPEIAENGAVVPVSVTSNIPKTESIAILIDKNPNTLAALFNIPTGTDPSVSTRVKMGETSQVHALIRADGRYFVATREIKVTLGGCGG
jgi:sulfur-oxidizing protein SoxY